MKILIFEMTNANLVITKDVFIVLLDAIYDSFEKTNIHGNAPKKNTRAYFGYDTRYKDQKNTLNYAIANSEEVKKYILGDSKDKSDIRQHVNTRKLIDSLNDVKKKGKKEVVFTTNKLKHIYFRYIGFKNINDFIKNYAFFKTEDGRKILKEQQELWVKLKRQNFIYDEEYKLCAYSADDLKKLSEYVIQVNYGEEVSEKSKNRFEVKAKLIINTEHKGNKGKKEYFGIVQYKRPHLFFFFERNRETTKDGWQPLSMFFYVDIMRHPKELEIMVGTFSSVSRTSENTISGRVILCKSDIFDDRKDSIYSYLWIKKASTVVRNPRDNQLSTPFHFLKPENDTRGRYKSLPGEYELYGFYPGVYKVFRFKLVIERHYKAYVTSEEEAYNVTIRHVERTFLLYLRRYNDKHDRDKIISPDGLITFDISPVKRLARGKIQLFDGVFSGTDRENNSVGFPMLLVKVEKALEETSFHFDDIETDFFSERPENKAIYAQLVEMERKRWDDLEGRLPKIELE